MKHILMACSLITIIISSGCDDNEGVQNRFPQQTPPGIVSPNPQSINCNDPKFSNGKDCKQPPKNTSNTPQEQCETGFPCMQGFTLIDLIDHPDSQLKNSIKHLHLTGQKSIKDALKTAFHAYTRKKSTKPNRFSYKTSQSDQLITSLSFMGKEARSNDTLANYAMPLYNEWGSIKNYHITLKYEFIGGRYKLTIIKFKEAHLGRT